MKLFYEQAEKAKDGSLPLDEAIEYIEQNYQKNIRLEDLCEVANVSKQHLCRLFKNTLQMRPMEYVTKVRIQHAKSLLITTNYSIKEIAEMVGFSDNSYFAIVDYKQKTRGLCSYYGRWRDKDISVSPK